jgi:hypothetical protein
MAQVEVVFFWIFWLKLPRFWFFIATFKKKGKNLPRIFAIAWKKCRKTKRILRD